MQTRALARILAMICLLLCLTDNNSNAQDEKEKVLVNPQAVINSDQLRRAARAVVQPTVTATQPTATAAQKTINLSDFKAALGTNVRLTQFDPATKLTKDISASSFANLRVGEYIAVASDRIRLEPLSNSQGREYSSFPTMLITKTADGTTSNLRVDTYSDGFAWNKDDTTFEASISLAVSDMDNPRSNAQLETPISIKISGQALVGKLPPVEISRLGFAGEKDVIVRSEGRNDPVAVTIRHEIDPQAPQNIDLPLSKPTLTISANPSAIAAFGIEATEITINSNGTLPPGFPITLDSDAGTFDPKTIEMGAGGIATTRLWSASIGRTKVLVLDDRFLVSDETIRFLNPVGFLIAMVLGAALGATFIYFWQRSKGSASIWAWCAAFVFGIGITIAAFAGFEIPKMLDLPQGRAGLVVPAATSFIAAILTSTIYAALSGSAAKKAEEPVG